MESSFTKEIHGLISGVLIAPITQRGAMTALHLSMNIRLARSDSFNGGRGSVLWDSENLTHLQQIFKESECTSREV